MSSNSVCNPARDKQIGLSAARSSHFVITRMITDRIQNSQPKMNDTGKSNGNRTEWSPIRSVIILVINKSDSRCVVVRCCYHT